MKIRLESNDVVQMLGGEKTSIAGLTLGKICVFDTNRVAIEIVDGDDNVVDRWYALPRRLRSERSRSDDANVDADEDAVAANAGKPSRRRRVS